MAREHLAGYQSPHPARGKGGFDSFWVMDHFYQLHGSVEEPFLDAWAVLPAFAAVTSRIRLGAMVSPVGYRNPALLTRMAASLDHISGGRMNFGFGAVYQFAVTDHVKWGMMFTQGFQNVGRSQQDEIRRGSE